MEGRRDDQTGPAAAGARLTLWPRGHCHDTGAAQVFLLPVAVSATIRADSVWRRRGVKQVAPTCRELRAPGRNDPSSLLVPKLLFGKVRNGSFGDMRSQTGVWEREFGNESLGMRALLKANPQIGAKEAVAALGAKGVEVSDNLFYFVKGHIKGGKGRKNIVKRVVAKMP